MIARMELVSNCVCMGPRPENEDITEQKVLLECSGRVCISYFMFLDHSLKETKILDLDSERMADFLNRAESVFFNNRDVTFKTDVGRWFLKVWDLDNRLYEFSGSMGVHKRLSKALRKLTGVSDLFAWGE